MLVSIVFLANHLPEGDQVKPNGPLRSVLHPKRFRFKRKSVDVESAFDSNKNGLTHHPEHRIAIILPFVGQGPQDIPPYLQVFCLGAAAAAPIADFLLIHNGVLSSSSSSSDKEAENSNHPFDCPPNVIFINLGSTLAMAEHLVRVVDHKFYSEAALEDADSTANANEEAENALKSKLTSNDGQTLSRHQLVQLVARHLQVYPYCLVEFKPALGFVFSEYLESSLAISRQQQQQSQTYTHWGYSDLDMLYGDLSSWITPDELNDFDLVTYGFGDQQRLYVRGQFTIHQNKPHINELWRSCEYLTNLDDRLTAVIRGKEKYRFESAEGCYSAAILKRKDIKVKFASKAWTDISRHDTAYSHGIYFSRPGKNHPMVLSKAATKHDLAGLDRINRMRGDAPIANTRQVMIGDRIPIALPNNPSAKCMYWVQQKYQSHLCLTEHVQYNETLFWIDGQLYRQAHLNSNVIQTEAGNSMITGPFFHFQEWKRYYRPNQLAVMHYSSLAQNFALTKEGAIPLKNKRDRPMVGDDNDFSFAAADSSSFSVSPLRNKEPPKQFWRRRRRHHSITGFPISALPQQTYCLISGPRKIPPQPPAPQCYHMVSWHDHNHVEILSAASEWQNLIDINAQVTLVLTFQISAGQASEREALSDIVEHIATNLERWQRQPCVTVIHVAGVTDDTLIFLRNRFQSDLSFDNALIAVVFQEESHNISRKALMNMAMDAVPTRWYLTGMELERGLVLSTDSVVLAHRAAADAYKSGSTGMVLIIPQFAVDSDDSDLGVQRLLQLQNIGQLKRPADVENDKCDEGDLVFHLEQPDDLWWDQVEALLIDEGKTKRDFDQMYAQRAESMVDMEVSFLELLTDKHHLKMFALDQSPILMIDNLGPQLEMRTDEMVREVEELGGRRCYNGLKLSQLAALGYHFDVLGGAFAVSTTETRRATYLGTDENLQGSSRCDGCFMFADEHEDILEDIVKDEIRRPSKSAVLWAEMEEN